MANFPTLRLRNGRGVTDGQWYADTITPYHIRALAEYRQAEPDAGWRLETRGYEGVWHIVK